MACEYFQEIDVFQIIVYSRIKKKIVLASPTILAVPLPGECGVIIIYCGVRPFLMWINVIFNTKPLPTSVKLFSGWTHLWIGMRLNLKGFPLEMIQDIEGGVLKCVDFLYLFFFFLDINNNNS